MSVLLFKYPRLHILPGSPMGSTVFRNMLPLLTHSRCNPNQCWNASQNSLFPYPVLRVSQPASQPYGLLRSAPEILRAQI